MQANRQTIISILVLPIYKIDLKSNKAGNYNEH